MQAAQHEKKKCPKQKVSMNTTHLSCLELKGLKQSKSFSSVPKNESLRPIKKICVFPVTCFLKLGKVGLIFYFFIFCNNFVCLKYFCKNRTAISTFFSLSRGVTARCSSIFTNG